MPRMARNRIRAAAEVLKQIGETVILLIESPDLINQATTTADSIVDEQMPQPTANDTQVPIYAKVTYVTGDVESYDEAGRVTNSKIEVQSTSKNMTSMIKCDRVMLNSGEMYRVDDKQWSEGREYFVLKCTIYIGGQV